MILSRHGWLANQTQIAGMHDQRSACLHLPTLMLAARNLFELCSVLLKAVEACILRLLGRLDCF